MTLLRFRSMSEPDALDMARSNSSDDFHGTRLMCSEHKMVVVKQEEHDESGLYGYHVTARYQYNRH